MALASSRGSRDYSEYVGAAKNLAESQQLDFLEFVDGDGTIISSAQWPAKFGYKDASVVVGRPIVERAFLKQEELPDGTVLALVSQRELKLGDSPLFVIGGMRVDKNFLASMELPVGMRVMLYQHTATAFSAQSLVASEPLNNAALLAPLVGKVEQDKQEATETVHWSQDAADDEGVHAIPLVGPDKQLMAVLLIGSSQRPYVEVARHIRSAALLVGSAAEVADKILAWQRWFGNQRFLAQLTVGPMPHDRVMQAVERFGSEVAPAVRNAAP
jgi:hypothetical protein